MRQFSDWEIELLKKIASIKPSEQVALDRWLEQSFFREADGRALIIQAKSRFAVFFLRPDVFEDAQKKDKEMVKFMELISLFIYLQNKGYITLFRGLTIKRKEMFFIQDKFINPLPKGDNIILNSRGDYTSGPDTIHNKEKQIVYKGEYFDLDPFENILNATTGIMYVSASISELLETIQKPTSQVTPKALPQEPKPKEKSNPEPNNPVATPSPEKKNTESVATQETTLHETHSTKPEKPVVSLSPQQHTTPKTKENAPPPQPVLNKKAKRNKEMQWLLVLSVTFLVIMVVTGSLAYRILKEYDQKLTTFNNKQNNENREVNSALNELRKMKKRIIELDDCISADIHGSNARKESDVYYGIDVSKWNGNIIEDIDYLDSLSFVICKATGGLNFVDPEFPHNWSTIKRKGLIRGAYHFFYVDKDPKKQANFYCSKIGALGSTDMAPIVDIESASIPFQVKIDKNTLQKNLKLYIKQIETTYNRKPIIYTNLAFANKFLKLEFFANYPLWLAEYTGDNKPLLPILWQQKGCKIWQKSASYDLHSKHADFDVFYGRKADLYNDAQ